MASIFKPAGKSKYVILYHDKNGKRRKKTGATDKQVTERIARDLENRIILLKEGTIDPKAEAYRDHEAKPLAAHLVDYEAALVARGNTRNHCVATVSRIKKVLSLAKFKLVSDLSVSGALDAIQILRTRGFNQQTLNHHIRAVKGFSRWLHKEGRSREHLLAYLATTDPEADRRRVRRSLAAEEAARLVLVTEAAPTLGGMSGLDRSMLYALTIGTGLRRKELRTLIPSRFNLETNPPTVRVLACYSKNGSEAVQPLAHSLADRLRPWLSLKPAGKPVFEGMTKRTADMLAIDLKAAGIEPETDSGVIDFHALRTTYVSHLVSSGASVKTSQVLARHSSPVVTIGVYAKASLHDISGAVESLPDLTPAAGDREAMSATGTEGNSLPTATQNATSMVVDGSQVQSLQVVSASLSQDLGSCPARGEGSNPSSRNVETNEAPTEFWLTDDGPAVRLGCQPTPRRPCRDALASGWRRVVGPPISRRHSRAPSILVLTSGLYRSLLGSCRNGAWPRPRVGLYTHEARLAPQTGYDGSKFLGGKTGPGQPAHTGLAPASGDGTS